VEERKAERGGASGLKGSRRSIFEILCSGVTGMALAHGPALEAAQRRLVACLAEEALTRSEHGGVGEQPQFVDQVVLEQCLRQLRAREADDLSVEFLFQLRDLAHGFACQDRRDRPVSLFRP
jgi:hypothetical protein